MAERRARKGEARDWIGQHADYIGDDCLLWPFGRTAKGYGSVRYSGRTMHAHTAMCIAVAGRSPDFAFEVAHSCGNRLCCNPAHLRFASSSENHADMVTHGTSTRGERHGRARLTEDDVRAIRLLCERGRSQASLARDYEVDPKTVNLIVRRINWGWLN